MATVRRTGVRLLAALAFCLVGVAAQAQTVLSPLAIQHFTDNNGNLCVGCQLFTYAAGTTTPATTYTDSTGDTPNADPIILNTRGEAGVWLTPGVGYKFVLAPSTDTNPPTNPYWTVDNIFSALSPNPSGNVGIGTTTPEELLDVYGGSSATIRINGNATDYGPSISINSTGSGGQDWSLISNQTSNSGGVGLLSFYDNTSSALLLALSPGGALELYGPAGSAGHSLPQLVLNNEDNQTQNGAGGFIRFASLNSSNNPIDGVQLNGGLVSATAGDEMGDLDIAVYRDGTPQVVALSGPQGNSGIYGFWGPANNDAFVLGQSNLGWARLYMETQSQGDLYIDLNNANTSGRNWWIDSTGSGSGIAAGVLGFLDQSSGGGQFLLNSLSVPQAQWAAANSGGVEELGVTNTAGTTNSQAIVTASAGGNSTLSLTATYDGGAIIEPGSSETNLTIELGSAPLVITGLPSSSGSHALCINTGTGAVYIGAAGTGGC